MSLQKRLKHMSEEGRADYMELTHPEHNLYKRLSENLPKWARLIYRLDESNKQGKFNLPLNDRGLPF